MQYILTVYLYLIVIFITYQRIKVHELQNIHNVDSKYCCGNIRLYKNLKYRPISIGKKWFFFIRLKFKSR